MQTEATPSPKTSITPRTASAGTRSREKAAADKRRWRKLLPWIIGLAVVGLIVYGLLPKPLPVEIATVEDLPMEVSVLEEGKTRIRHRYTVSTPVAGHLRRPPLRAGAPIRQGETLLAEVQAEIPSLLNPRLLSEAEARVKAAQASLSMREAEAERARASLELAQKEQKRAETLTTSGAISKREYDTALSEASVRARELRAAEFARQVGGFEVQQAEAALLQAQKPEAQTGAPLPLIAPVDGFVLNVFEESARVLAPGAAIMEVGNPEDLEAEIELLSTDAAGVAPGATALIERWGGDQPLRAVVRLVEPAAFTKISALGVEEQRVRVRVDFSEPLPQHQKLGDRYRVEARIITWSSPGVRQIPSGALFRRGGDWMCYVFEGGKARLRKVEVGHSNGRSAEIKSGLETGERVVLHPPDAITPGSPIKERARE